MPIPRSGDGGSAPAAADVMGWQVLTAVTQLGEDVRSMRADITARFDQLPERFVPRLEIQAKWDESGRDRQFLHTELARCENKHDTDIQRLTQAHQAGMARLGDSLEAAVKALGQRMDGEEAERANAQRWALGLLATVLIAICGLGVTLFVNLH